MWYIEVMGQHLSFSIPILLNSRYNARYRLEISKAVSWLLLLMTIKIIITWRRGSKIWSLLPIALFLNVKVMHQSARWIYYNNRKE